MQHRFTSPLTLWLSLLLSTYVLGQEYAGYNQLLEKYHHPQGVDYSQWKAAEADCVSLKSILKQWSKIDSTTLPSRQQAAFRINLYNAAMIDIVLDHYPLKSVTKIGIPFSIFKKKCIVTPTGVISLDHLEKRQLLADFPDYRVHFAVNCASVSCPPLRAEAYIAERLEAQLEEQAKLFLTSSHAYQLRSGTPYYSPLFKWYKKDFGTSDPAQIINKHREEKVATSTQISWLTYDWRLNDYRAPQANEQP